jgi:hypothetical protein
VSSLRNRRLTSPQLEVSLNSNRKTPVSTSTVKIQLWDAGLLGRVAKKKPYLRLCLCSSAHLNILFLLGSLRWLFFVLYYSRPSGIGCHIGSLGLVSVLDTSVLLSFADSEDS